MVGVKRHPALQPLSREHHHALVLARRLERGAAGDLRRALDGWLGAHVELEERVLAPHLDDERAARLRAEHAELRRRGAEAGADPERLAEVGALLRAHVRWEERELFPWLEERCGRETLAELERGLAGGGGASCSIDPGGGGA